MNFLSKIYYKKIKKHVPSSIKQLLHPARTILGKVSRSTACKTEKDAFFDFVFSQNIGPSADFVPYMQHGDIKSRIKAIAFYLPQYHPIKENDEWWGNGFTEWTNVSKAVPQFIGHYQPKLPGELGFYDLRILDVQRRQIELAKNYGLYGFCYHYYWFSGKKLLDLPLNNLLANPDLDFPFCINWANGHWTKKWDGLENNILMKQEHSSQDDINFIRETAKLFEDKRYIRIKDKPLIMIYRPAALPNARKTVELWREHCIKKGIGDIYVISTHTEDYIPPTEFGVDACTEFAPNNLMLQSFAGPLNMVNADFSGIIFDYESLVKSSSHYKKPKYVKFRSACPGWDNEARKPGRGTILTNSGPNNYQKWLECICNFTDSYFEDEEKLIFINAWNEWAEGAYLEPDRKYGYAYLDRTYKTLAQYNQHDMS